MWQLSTEAAELLTHCHTATPADAVRRDFATKWPQFDLEVAGDALKGAGLLIELDNYLLCLAVALGTYRPRAVALQLIDAKMQRGDLFAQTLV